MTHIKIKDRGGNRMLVNWRQVRSVVDARDCVQVNCIGSGPNAGFCIESCTSFDAIERQIQNHFVSVLEKEMKQ